MTRHRPKAVTNMTASPELTADGRRTHLAGMVEDSGYFTTAELAAQFGVSEMTIRRDITRLERDGMVRSVHGGVASVGQTSELGTDFAERSSTSRNVKWTIAAAAAASHLPDEGIIAIDAGTTTAMIATLLPTGRPLNVISNSLPVFTIAATMRDVHLTALGGTFHPTSLSFTGPLTMEAISHLHVGTLFLGASGINERGVFCGNDYDASTKRALIDAAQSVVLVCDSSKFGATAMARVAALDAVDHVIVDDGLSAAHIAMLKDHGLSFTLVPVHRTSEDSP